MNISERIQNLRKSKGISQEQLAENIGVSRQAVSKWEIGQAAPDTEKIILLSEYFNTTTDYILRGIEPDEKNTDKRNSVIFSIAGTVVNAIGIITATAVWLERRTVYAVAAGFSLIIIGTAIFLIGQLTDGSNKLKAKLYFTIPNIWIIPFIPASLCFNIIDGLCGGFYGEFAPLPLLKNSVTTFAVYLSLYITICSAASITVLYSRNRSS